MAHLLTSICGPPVRRGFVFRLCSPSISIWKWATTRWVLCNWVVGTGWVTSPITFIERFMNCDNNGLDIGDYSPDTDIQEFDWFVCSIHLSNFLDRFSNMLNNWLICPSLLVVIVFGEFCESAISATNLAVGNSICFHFGSDFLSFGDICKIQLSQSNSDAAVISAFNKWSNAITSVTAESAFGYAFLVRFRIDWARSCMDSPFRSYFRFQLCVENFGSVFRTKPRI